MTFVEIGLLHICVRYYNYDGIAYNGSGGVALKSTYQYANADDLLNWSSDSIALPMDLRGLGEFSENIKYLAGGMEENQQVSNKTWKINLDASASLDKKVESIGISVFPNPFNDQFKLQLKSNFDIEYIEITDIFGRSLSKYTSDSRLFELGNLKVGMYQLILHTKNGDFNTKLVKN